MTNGTNNTTTNGMQQVGAVVKVTRSGGWHSKPSCYVGQVAKVWKNGAVEVQPHAADPACPKGKVFGPRVYTFDPIPMMPERGRGHTSISPLADDETPESIVAARKASEAAETDAAEQAKAQRKADIYEWWTTYGEQVWAARETRAFAGTEIHTILATDRYGDERLVMVRVFEDTEVLSETMRFRLETSGLQAHHYGDGPSRRTDISSYSRSCCYGATLAEALYDAIR